MIESLKHSGKSSSHQAIADFESRVGKLSLNEARAFARSLGVDPFWSSDYPRTKEGFFRVLGGTAYAAARSAAFAPYADLVWMESARPDLQQVLLMHSLSFKVPKHFWSHMPSQKSHSPIAFRGFHVTGGVRRAVRSVHITPETEKLFEKNDAISDGSSFSNNFSQK